MEIALNLDLSEEGGGGGEGRGAKKCFTQGGSAHDSNPCTLSYTICDRKCNPLTYLQKGFFISFLNFPLTLKIKKIYLQFLGSV